MMTKTEVLKIFSVLREAYPQMRASENLNAAVSVWQMVLSDWNYQQISAALIAYIANDSKGFPPSPGQLLSQAQILAKKGEMMSEGEAWSLVKKAVSNGVYGAVSEFDKLPPECQAVVHTPETLRAWAMIDEHELDTVVASNFQRSYRAKIETQKKFKNVPLKIRETAALLFPEKENENTGYLDEYFRETRALSLGTNEKD